MSRAEGKREGEGGSGYKFNLNYHVSSVCGPNKTLLWVLGLQGGFEFQTLEGKKL